MTPTRARVYIFASRCNGHALRRRTSDLACRVWQHRSNAIGGLVQDYDLHRLVFVEFHETMADAILREKQDQEMAASVETGAD
jgi:putative endonuclease